MKALSELNIDNYINWYKKWSSEIKKVEEIDKRLKRLVIAADYLEERIGRNLEKSPKSKQYMQKFDNKAEQLKIEISPLTFYTDNWGDERKIAFIVPSENDWAYLDECREVRMQIDKIAFIRDSEGNIYNEAKFAENKLDEISKKILDKRFLEYAKRGLPIPNLVKTGLEQDIFSEASKKEWKEFCYWVHYIDFAKWLDEKISGTEELTFYKSSIPQLKWEAPVNTLYTLFYDMLNEKLITWNGKGDEGDKMEIARMLSNYFVNKEGEPLSVETIKQAMKPGTPKAKKRIDIKAFCLTVNKSNKKT